MMDTPEAAKSHATQNNCFLQPAGATPHDPQEGVNTRAAQQAEPAFAFAVGLSTSAAQHLLLAPAFAAVMFAFL